MSCLSAYNLQPVVQPAHHDRADRTHRADVLPLFAAGEPAFERLRHFDALRQGERDRGVDADPAPGRLFDRGDTGRGHRNLDDDVGRECAKCSACRTIGVGVAIEARIGLHRNRPFFPPAHRRSASTASAPLTDISSTSFHAISCSVAAGIDRISSRIRSFQSASPSSAPRPRSPGCRWRRPHRDRSRSRARRERTSRSTNTCRWSASCGGAGFCRPRCVRHERSPGSKQPTNKTE